MKTLFVHFHSFPFGKRGIVQLKQFIYFSRMWLNWIGPLSVHCHSTICVVNFTLTLFISLFVFLTVCNSNSFPCSSCFKARNLKLLAFFNNILFINFITVLKDTYCLLFWLSHISYSFNSLTFANSILSVCLSVCLYVSSLFVWKYDGSCWTSIKRGKNI